MFEDINALLARGYAGFRPFRPGLKLGSYQKRDGDMAGVIQSILKVLLMFKN